MIQELLSDFATKYSQTMGNSRIMLAFIVALLLFFCIRETIDFNPFVLILVPFGAVAAAFSKVVDASRNKKNKWIILYVVFFVVIAVTYLGERIYSEDHIERAQNMMHIPEADKQVMDYLLSHSDNPKVLAMPDYCMYYRIYSSRFDMLYEQRREDDIRYLQEDARNAFNELKDHKTDMEIVSDAAISSGCDYIVLMNDYYWTDYMPDAYDYELVETIDCWNIYAPRKESDE